MNKKHKFKFVSPYSSGASGCCSVIPQHQNAILVTIDAYTPEISQGVTVENLLVEPVSTRKSLSSKNQQWIEYQKTALTPTLDSFTNTLTKNCVIRNSTPNISAFDITEENANKKTSPYNFPLSPIKTRAKNLKLHPSTSRKSERALMNLRSHHA